MTSRVDVVIVGGGLSGLHAAALLEARGVHNIVLLEAQSMLGGRIRSESLPAVRLESNKVPSPSPSPSPSPARFDLGATWFWPELQTDLASLVHELALPVFPQAEQGSMLIDRSLTLPPMRTAGYPSLPSSMRIAGGMKTFVEALSNRTHPSQRRLGTKVIGIRQVGSDVEVEAIDSQHRIHRWTTTRVLLALPPRLAAVSINFKPPLPDPLARQWRETPTWMAAHAKYVAVFDQPFWQATGLSGEARSSVGPMAEIHDASHPGGPYALFGFIGMPAASRAKISRDAMCNACRLQLTRLFGSDAASPIAEHLKDWSLDPHTADVLDLQPVSAHAWAPAPGASDGPWKHRLWGIGSEWSREFSGYVAGAVDAAREGVERVMTHWPQAMGMPS